jgi:diguanylate cyclase
MNGVLPILGIILALCGAGYAAHLLGRSSAGGETRPALSDDKASVERSRAIIHALLADVSKSVTDLVGSTDTYSQSLEGYRLSIQRTETLAGLKEIERLLLEELDGIKAVTERYRTQLAEAKETIREQAEQLLKVRAEADLDPLTRIANRGTFDKRLAEEMNRAGRYGIPLTLAVVDIDNFKVINDTHGHVTGDRVIRGVARVLTEQRRESDFVARYGGEEFAIILTHTDELQARAMVDRVRRKVEESRFVIEGESLSVTCSVGLAKQSSKEEKPEAFVSRADKALYQAKEGGRNRIETAPTPSMG